MNREEKEKLDEKLNKVLDQFWNIDCLLRVIKEILTNNNWEMREEDVELICKMLFKLSNELVSEIKEIKLQPNV